MKCGTMVALAGLVLGAFPWAGADDGLATESGSDSGGEVITNSISMKLRRVPAGSFIMGSPRSEAGHTLGEPQHRVTLTRSFYIGIHEVTQGQYAAVMGRNPSFFKGSARPVERVSWHDCQLFLLKLNEHERATGGLPDGWNYRLPTDAEWEYCCRAGSQTPYCFGSRPKQLGEYAWFRDNSGKTARDRQTHDVGRKKPNAWGLYDMHGNVGEWCEDRYKAGKVPPGGDATDPVGPETGSLRPVRGGYWGSVAEFCRAASKSGHGPGDTVHAIGLRVVLAPAGTSGAR